MTRISEAVMLFLVNAAWQASLVALLVSVSDRLLRKAAARYRHALWVVALVTCAVLTLSSLLQIAPANALLPSPAFVDLDQHSSRKLTVARPPSEHAAAARRVSRLTLPQTVVPIVALSKPLALTIAVLYGLLLLYRIRLLLKAWERTRSLLRSARTVELSTPMAQALACCTRRLALGPVSVLSSATVAVPATAGALRPVLILPEHLLGESDLHLLTSALGHEAAHIARRDYLLNLIYEFASLPLWFHPAVRLVLRRIRQTRELCCDEIVAERLLEPRIYAQSLVQLAGAALPFGRPAATITVGIADADILEERIMSILKYSPARLQHRNALLLIAVSLFVVPCIAAAPFAVHVAIHQPAMAAATSQAGAPNVAPGSQSIETQKAAPETIKLLTSDGEETSFTGRRPKVGDVVTAGHRKMKIVSIDREGKYRAYVFKNSDESPSGEAVVKPKGDVNAREQTSRSQAELRERAEHLVREKHEEELSEQELQERRQEDRAKRAAFAQRQAELAQRAKIPMDQAIQIALRETPGTVLEARLVGERDTVTYFISILPPNGTGNDTTELLINALDGSIMESGHWKQER